MNVTIRPIRPEDYEDLAEIMACPGVFRNISALPYVSLDVRREQLADIKPPDYRMAAEVDGKVVGDIHLTQWKGVSSHCGHFGIAVHDDYQGQGIGSRLMETMIDLADNQLGLTRIELMVQADNHRAIALYEKFGFEIEGRHRKFVFRDSEFIDTYTMARLRM